MATKELSAHISQRIRQLGVTKTQVIKRSKLSRQAFYNILNDKILEETKLSTFISLAHALEVHPLILMRQYFHGWELPVWSSKDTKYPKDHSGFVRDVTYPDNSLVTVNQEFEKIWEIQNLGEVIWENRRLVCIDEELVIISHDYLSDDRWMMMRSGLAVLKGLPVLSSQSNSLTTNMVKVF